RKPKAGFPEAPVIAGIGKGKDLALMTLIRKTGNDSTQKDQGRKGKNGFSALKSRQSGMRWDG
ncbi:MAG TPA: hypothetical protein VKV30_03415, partial [Candidatus Angelobacter sp.]|nr:hypothetical protein [Candidatus Angelobacter sp.]